MEINAVAGQPDWWEVTGPNVEQPFRMRLGVRNGRAVAIGLTVDNGAEVTTRTLRSIRLGQALDEWNQWMLHDQHEAEEWEPRLAEHLEHRRRQGVVLSPEQRSALSEYGRQVASRRSEWRELLDNLPKAGPVTRHRGRGAKPPTDSELQTFARTYIEEFLARPRGAVQRTADKHGMHRVTAHRWISLCREANYIPEED